MYYYNTPSSQLHKMRLHTFTEACYLAVIALYVLKASFGTTLFYISWPANYENILYVLAYTVILLRIRHWKMHTAAKWLLGLLALIIFKYSWISTGYNFLLDTALLIIGAIGIPYKRILKTAFWIGICVLLLAILGSLIGCISDLVYLDNEHFMHSFGIVYPTDFASHIVFLFLAGWVLYGKAIGILPTVLAAGLCLFVYRYTGSKCSTIVLFLSAIGSLYIYLTEKYEKQIRIAKQPTKQIDKILIYVCPICALVMISLTLLYNTENHMMDKLNTLLTGRLSLGKNAIDKYGITAFGTAFAQQGYGGSTAWSWALEYTFVDCSYVLMIVRYGWAVLLVSCMHTVYTSIEAYNHKQRRLLMAIALVAIHSMIEHHFLEIEYNIFLLLPFTEQYPYETNKKKGTVYSRSLKSIICAAGICICTLAIIFFPRFVTYMKTIVDLSVPNTYETRMWFIVIMTCCILWFTIFAGLILKTFFSFATKSPMRWIRLIGMLILLIILIPPLKKGEEVIRKGQYTYRSLLETDRPIIETLLAEDSSERIYIDHIPEIYKREFSSISDKILPPEGFATRKNITLITKDEGELRALISAGYVYGELASGHAVYTNSEYAKTVLEKFGIKLTDYYSRRRFLNLIDSARKYKLKTTEDGTFLLTSTSDALVLGPGVAIYKGTLQVQYTLRLICHANTNENIAIVRIYSDSGQHMWKEENIYLKDFDKNGISSYVLECNLPFDCPNVEFTLSVTDNTVLEVQAISYAKVK